MEYHRATMSSDKCHEWYNLVLIKSFIVRGRGQGGRGGPGLDVEAGEGQRPLPAAPGGLQLAAHHLQLLAELLAPDSQRAHLLLSLVSHLKIISNFLLLKLLTLLTHLLQVRVQLGQSLG